MVRYATEIWDALLIPVSAEFDNINLRNLKLFPLQCEMPGMNFGKTFQKNNTDDISFSYYIYPRNVYHVVYVLYRTLK